MKDGDFYSSVFAGTTAGLQAAIDYLGGGKGKVFIGPGTLSTSTTIWVHSGCHVQGSGIGVTVIKRTSMANGDAADSGSVFATSAYGSNGTLNGSSATQSDIAFTDLTVDGNYSAFGAVTQANLVPAGFYVNYTDGVRITRCEALNTLGDGFRIRFCRNASLIGVETNTCGQWGTVAARNAVNFIGDGAAAGAWGYNYSLIGANLVNTGDEAIQASMINLLTITNVNVDGCDFVLECSPASGTTAGTFTDWAISNITAVNSLDYFIAFSQGQGGAYTLQDPGFYNCHFHGHATLHDGGAVAMPQVTGFVVNGLNLLNCSFRNINTKDTTTHHWLDSQPADATGVTGLTIVGCQFTGKSGSVRTGAEIGINLRGSHADVMISDVLLKDMAGTAIRLNDTTVYAGTVQRNIIFNNVLVDGCSDFAYRITVSSAGTTASFTEIQFKGCTARNACAVTSGAAFQLFSNQAGGTIQGVDYLNCRAYKTTGSTLTHGLGLSQTAGTVDNIEIGLCDFSGTATGWFTISGTWTNVLFTDYPRRASTASGSSITLPQGDLIYITGTSDINTITPWFVWDRRPITLKFSSNAGVTGIVDGSNLKLASTMLYTTDDTITLRYDQADAVWYEIGRSVN